jgi:hypothetical protein
MNHAQKVWDALRLIYGSDLQVWDALRLIYGSDLQAATVTVLIKDGDAVRFVSSTFPQPEEKK